MLEGSKIIARAVSCPSFIEGSHASFVLVKHSKRLYSR
jgi:hypothetical protein